MTDVTLPNLDQLLWYGAACWFSLPVFARLRDASSARARCFARTRRRVWVSKQTHYVRAAWLPSPAFWQSLENPGITSGPGESPLIRGQIFCIAPRRAQTRYRIFLTLQISPVLSALLSPLPRSDHTPTNASESEPPNMSSHTSLNALLAGSSSSSLRPIPSSRAHARRRRFAPIVQTGTTSLAGANLTV